MVFLTAALEATRSRAQCFWIVVLTVLSSAAAVAQAPLLPLSGRTNLWSDSRFTDSIGGRSATLVNKSSGYNFDGVDDYATLPGSFGGGAEYTVSVQFYADTSSRTVEALVASDDAAFLHLNVGSDSSAGVRVYTDQGAITLPPIPRSSSYAILSVRSGDTRLYINGTLVGTSSATFSRVLATSSLRFGSGLGGRYLTGSIFDVALYDRAITPAEARLLDVAYKGLYQVSVEGPTSVVYETSGSASFTITRQFTEVAETFRYEITGSGGVTSAFSPATGQIVFGVGESSRTVTLTILDNVIADFRRAYSFLATNVAGGLLRGIQGQTFGLELYDNEGPDRLAAGADFELSPGGRFVVVKETERGRLTSTDEIYLFDRMNRTKEQISLPTGEAPSLSIFPVVGNVFSISSSSDGSSSHPSISANGQLVVFESTTTNFTASDPNGALRDVYLRDRNTFATTRLISVPANREAWAPSITSDGRYILFATDHNFATSDTNGAVADAYVYDRVNATYTCASIRSSGGTSAQPATPLGISDDGKIVLFTSAGSDLVPGDTNGVADLFIRNLTTNTTTRVSVSSSGGQADAATTQGRLSGDGNVVSFLSAATNLVAGDTNGLEDAFLRDRTAGTTVRLDASTKSAPLEPGPALPALNADGSMVLYSSRRGMVGARPDLDLVLWDRTADRRTLLNVLPNGERVPFAGRTVALTRTATIVALYSSTAFDVPLAPVPGGLYPAELSSGVSVFPLALGASGAFSAIAEKAVVGEASGPARFRITRGLGFREGIAVSFRFAGSATSADVQATGGTLTFGFGETEKFIDVPLINDGLAEDPETLTLELYAPTLATLTDSATATITIADDDASPTVTLVDDEITVGESDGVVRVELRRNGGLAAPLTVTLSAQSISALSGSDYSGFTSRSLTFPAGEASLTTTVTLLDDLTVEGDETFRLLLSSSGATVTTGTSIVTILDTAPSTTDRFGHGLRLVDQPAVPIAANGSYSVSIIVENPAPGSSSNGVVEFYRVADRWAGNNPVPDDLPAGSAAVPALSSGGRFSITTGGTLALPAPGIDYFIYAVISEALGGTMVQQIAMPIAVLRGADFVDTNGQVSRRGATGGITEPSFSGIRSDFIVNSVEPPTLAAIRITGGRDALLASESTKFSVAGTMSNGADAGALAPSWSTSDFSVNGSGLFKTTATSTRRTVTITARVSSGGITRSAQKTVTVDPLPLPTFDPPTDFAVGVGRSFAVNFTASPLVSGFAVTGGQLPPNFALTSAGRLSGTTFTPGDYQATIAATNPTGTTSRVLSFRVREAIRAGTEGRYLGLSIDQTALLDLTVQASGAFTARLSGRRASASFKGFFTDGTTQVSRGRGGQDSLNLTLRSETSDDVLPLLSGQGAVGGEGNSFSLRRVVGSYAQSGVFTFSHDAVGPSAGDGFASFAISATALVRGTGVTGYGQRYSIGSAMTEDLRFPLFAAIESKLGTIAGDVLVDVTTGALSSSLRIHRIPGGKGARAGGFDGTSPLAGGLVASVPTGGFRVRFLEGGTEFAIDLDASQRLTSHERGVAFRYDPRSGLIAGTGYDGTVRRKFSGAWRSDLQAVVGQYGIARDEFGRLRIER